MRRALVPVVLSIPIALLACGGGGGGGAVSQKWTLPASLDAHASADGPDAWNPRAAMDSQGNAIVVWYQRDAANNGAVFMSEYRGGAWKNPASLTDHISLAGQSAGFPVVAMADNGDAIVAWSQNNGLDNMIYKSERRNGVWKHPAAFSDCIDIGGQNAQEPSVAMDGQGNTLLVWAVTGATGFHFYKAEYRGGAWTLPADLDDHIDPSGAEIANTAKVAMDDAGNAVIAWMQNVSSQYRIFKSDRRGGSWFHPVNLDDAVSPVGNNAWDPAVAVSDQGEAIIAWPQYVNNNDAKVFKSEYRAGKWTHPADLSDFVSPGLHGASVQAAMDADGNALVVWQDTSSGVRGIYQAEYRGGGWTYPVDMADRIDLGGDTATRPAVAMDGGGRAIAAWIQGDGTNRQLFKRERRGGAWVGPSSLTDHVSVAGSDVYDLPPVLAMSSDGTALVVWSQKDPATNQVFIAEYR